MGAIATVVVAPVGLWVTGTLMEPGDNPLVSFGQLAVQGLSMGYPRRNAVLSTHQQARVRSGIPPIGIN